MVVTPTQCSSGVYDDFVGRPTEEDLKTIENVSAQDAIVPNEIRLQPAWVILAIEQGPDAKSERCRGTARNAADQSLPAQSRRKLKELTIRLGQDARVCARIRDYPV